MHCIWGIRLAVKVHPNRPVLYATKGVDSANCGQFMNNAKAITFKQRDGHH